MYRIERFLPSSSRSREIRSESAQKLKGMQGDTGGQNTFDTVHTIYRQFDIPIYRNFDMLRDIERSIFRYIEISIYCQWYEVYLVSNIRYIENSACRYTSKHSVRYPPTPPPTHGYVRAASKLCTKVRFSRLGKRNSAWLFFMTLWNISGLVLFSFLRRCFYDFFFYVSATLTSTHKIKKAGPDFFFAHCYGKKSRQFLFPNSRITTHGAKTCLCRQNVSVWRVGKSAILLKKAQNEPKIGLKIGLK